ncbi:MAG TPA: hypothetical protein ENG66_05170 [Thermococcus sp.]|nr:hypothetical protein [Thermococcus sp.]
MRNCAIDEEIVLEKHEEFYVVYSPQVKGNFQLTLGDIKFKVCPLSWISSDSWYYLELFHLCKTLHCLPEEGGVLDQDNKTMEAFQIIATEIQRYSERMKSQELQMLTQLEQMRWRKS